MRAYYAARAIDSPVARKEIPMTTKVLKCRDTGADCDFVAQGSSEDEVMAKAAEHARKDHGFDDIPPELADKVKAAIHDA